MAWSALFKRAGTFSNYLGYLRLRFDILGAECSVFSHPLVRRAKTALAKNQAPARDKRFIQAPLLLDLMRLALKEGDGAASLYLASYTFMLRVLSEGLPFTLRPDPLARLDKGSHSCAAVVDNERLTPARDPKQVFSCNH